MDYQLISEILNAEMRLATGCTEPAAVALCAAYARQRLTGKPVKLAVEASTNIIKNAMSAGIPGSSRTGIPYAAAIGAFRAEPELELQIMDQVLPDVRAMAEQFVEQGRASVSRKETTERLYIEVTLWSEDAHQSKAVIAGSHTGLAYLEADHIPIFRAEPGAGINGISADQIEQTLSIPAIYAFAQTLDPAIHDLHMIEQAIEINARVAKEGSAEEYGLHIGRSMARYVKNGLFDQSVAMEAALRTACGIDARMGGANVPVVTNSGSGNQGITATIPLLTAAELLHIDKDRTFRAITAAHLMSIYIHCRFGRLSPLCGATVAGTGVACGLVFLLGGSAEQMGYAVNNMLGTTAGILCDGAKPDCAMKVAACVYTAFLAAQMAMEHIGIPADEGIVDADPAQTVRNFVRLGNEGSRDMDPVILDIMLHKQGSVQTAR